MGKDRGELLHGTLEMLALQTLRAKAMHGFAISREIRSGSDGYLAIEEGSLYPALYRMQRRGWLSAEWGRTEKQRRAKYYSLTSAGERQLAAASERWVGFVTAVAKVMRTG